MSAPPTTTAVGGTSKIFNVTVSTFQSGITVADGAITGTLTKTNAFANPWGEGYFLALKWSGADLTNTIVTVGLSPTAGTGMLPLDEDKNCLFHVSMFDDDDKPTQKVVVRCASKADPLFFVEQEFDLSGLTLSEG